MRILFTILASLAGLYSLLIMIRVIISWFGASFYGRPAEILANITDPYLDWWRRTLGLKAGFLDLSPVAAMAALSLAQSVFSALAERGSISLGIILGITILAVWSAASFIFGFCLVIVILRFIAYLTNRNIYSPFWRIIDSISQPLLYRINRIIFGKRLVNYLAGMITAATMLAVILVGGHIAVRLLAEVLFRLPL